MTEYEKNIEVYSFHKKTKEYLHSEYADVDQRTGETLMPADATSIKPEIFAGFEEALVFENQNWVKKIDFRGKGYWLKDGTKIIIDKISEGFPEDALRRKPDLRSLDQAKLDAFSEIDKTHEKCLKLLTKSASNEEKNTWQIKALASNAILKNKANISQLEMIKAEAISRDVTLRELSEKILEKQKQFLVNIGISSAIKSKFKKRVSEAKTNIDITFVISGLRNVFRDLVLNQ